MNGHKRIDKSLFGFPHKSVIMTVQIRRWHPHILPVSDERLSWSE